MNKLTTATVLAAGVALSSQVAQAYNFNDLILGFGSSTAGSEYVIDLGNANIDVGVGGSSVVYLGGDISSSTFSSVFSSGAVGVNMGVVGGENLFPSSHQVYATQVRGGAGDASVADSVAPGNINANSLALGANEAAGVANGYNLAAAGASATGSKGGNYSFNTLIAPTFNSQSFWGLTGVDPLGQIGNSSVLYEDLYFNSNGNGWNYEGYFTLDMSGETPSLSFTPEAVPEPAMTLVGGAGLLLILGRRSLSRKAA